MGVLSRTWLTTGLIMLTSPPGSTSDALGLFLLLAGLGLFVSAIAAASGKLVAVAVLGTAALRLACTGVYELTASRTWEDVAGVVGLVLLPLGGYAPGIRAQL